MQRCARDWKGTTNLRRMSKTHGAMVSSQEEQSSNNATMRDGYIQPPHFLTALACASELAKRPKQLTTYLTLECATSENLNIWSISFANPTYSRYVHGLRDISHRQLVHPDHPVPTIRLSGHTQRTLSIGNVQRSLIRHGNGASSWFRRPAEPELMTQTEPQTLRRHTTCGHRGRVAFSYSKTENKRVWELRSSRQQSRVTFQSLWSARHSTQTQHSNARRERETTEPLLLLRRIVRQRTTT